MPVLEEMETDLRDAPEVILPSGFWTALNQLNRAQLSGNGYENFKRTLARNYFTWVVSPRDSQVGFLFRALPLSETLAAALRALAIGRHELFSRKESLYYSFLTLMLWKYVCRQPAGRLLDELEEPVEGNPPRVYYRGRLIAQDLANSVMEYHSITEALGPTAVQSVLELGAGYGRTAYVFLKRLPRVRYVIADLPPALYVSQRYLGACFPERKIFQYRNFHRFQDVEREFSESQVAFLLPHQIALLPDGSVDLFLNISSFHEMRFDQIAYYFKHIGRLARYLYLKEWTQTTVPIDGISIAQSDYPLAPHWKHVFWRECAVQTKFFEALVEITRRSESARTKV